VWTREVYSQRKWLCSRACWRFWGRKSFGFGHDQYSQQRGSEGYVGAESWTQANGWGYHSKDHKEWEEMPEKLARVENCSYDSSERVQFQCRLRREKHWQAVRQVIHQRHRRRLYKLYRMIIQFIFVYHSSWIYQANY